MSLNTVIIIILIILIYKLFSAHHTDQCNNLLSGFWEADDKFCKEAGIDVFCIYIDDKIDFSGKRACYILIHKNGDFLINDPALVRFSMQFAAGGNWNFNMKKPKHYNVRFYDIEYEFFPNAQEAKFYPICNKLILFNGDEITAVLYKNSANTETKFINDCNMDEKAEVSDSDEDE